MGRRALAASRSEQTKLAIDLMSDDEDDDLDAPVFIRDSKSSKYQLPRKYSGPAISEVTRLSKLEIHAKPIAASTSSEDELRERRTRMKRKAKDDLRMDGVKRSPSTFLAPNVSSARSSGLPSLPNLPCKFIAR